MKIVLWVECFQEEIRVFILYECNEKVVTDIFKMEDIFGMYFFPDLCAQHYYFVIMKRKQGWS